MKAPILDPRTKADIMKLIKKRAASYVPEWHYDGDPSDPGAALAEIFGDMFYQTVDRFNSLPGKTYTEFLNLLGVQIPPVTPATGFLRFNVHEGVEEPVAVPAGTAVFAKDENSENDENVVYETERRMEATPAKLRELFFSDSREGVIQRVDMGAEQRFFQRVDSENMQAHRMLLSQNDVLSVTGPCTVEVEIRMSARFLEDATVKKLTDPEFASWSWYDGEKQVPFDGVSAEDGAIRLTKNGPGPMCPDEEGHICLCCDMASMEGNITIDGVTLRSSPAGALAADSLANNDIPIPQDEGGYCFGRMPAAYELFYIRSDSVFRKHGAEANVKLDIVPIVYTEVDGKPQYVWSKRIIDKNDAVVVKPDDVFIQQVVWEYFNGSGWARLEVGGNKNPFSGKSEGSLEMTFSVPEDLQAALVNSEEGYYIRARVVNVENSMSMNPRWILPFVKSVDCTWQYGSARNAEWLSASNNARTEVLEGASLSRTLALNVFSNMEEHPKSMYLCFDRSPNGMPLSMFFDIRGRAAPEGKVIYEMWNGSGFERLRLVDGTRNMLHTGPVFLYIPEALPEAEFFGERGYWLRMSLSSYSEQAVNCPVVGDISFNIVGAVQRQRAQDQYFSCGVYDAGKRVRLTHAPVMSCSVWIDEAGSIAQSEISRLERLRPDSIRTERENGAVKSCLIKWEQVPSLAMAEAGERVFELDSYTGVLTFGSGKNGMVPPAGYRNMCVSYAYGGGSRGNMPVGAVTEFLGSVPRISSLSNVTPMSGGTDRIEMERLEELGNKRLRHRGKAVGAADFEELVAEKFTRAVHVKCFTGRDEKGQKAPGHVCLVVMGGDLDGERMARDLCREIYEYLARRSDCCMVASGRLHVRPSTDMTVNTAMSVQMRDLDLAAETQQKLVDTVTELINGVWRTREIGAQINPAEILQAVKAVPNVEAVVRVSIEGVYYEDGRRMVRPIEDGSEFAYATVTSGAHTVRIY